MTPERIGITGHRWNRLRRSAEAEIVAALAGAFAEIDARDVSRPRLLVSGMAEGTDLLAARHRPASWSLEAVLPLPVDAWRAFVAEQEGVTAADIEGFDAQLAQASTLVLPSIDDAPDFDGLARHIAETCHKLIAVWDGTAGQPGGTGTVVSLARARGVPVHVIGAGDWMR
jgi:hypothetical protein